MPDNSQIFKATYSGIPVYEMICKGVAVMRRKSDRWLNATQILKVAGFDKPQRTRVLEREVQKGQHEKVQGGYGKYQGTWVPMERGIAVAKQYNVEHILRPIIEFVAADASPPLAPKHITAAPTKAKRKEAPDPHMGTRGLHRNSVAPDSSDESDHSASPRPSDEGSMTPSPSAHSQSTRTPSPLVSIKGSGESEDGEEEVGTGDEMELDTYFNGRSSAAQTRSDGRAPKRKAGRLDERPSQRARLDEAPREAYDEVMLEYFLSEAQNAPPFLLNPPPDFDPDVIIDEEGHTALHWACALGRVKVVKMLLSANANQFQTNKAGQPALMRGVMFANNYDLRKFPELFEMLHRSVLNVDNYRRTIFHHIIDLALTKQKTHAARYYLETLLGRMGPYQADLADILNLQDNEGETALTLAARARSKRLVKLLIDYGANPKIPNNDGKSAEDYILEDERFRASPPIHYRPPYGTVPPPQLFYSRAAQRAAGEVTRDMVALLESLSATYEGEMQEKERDLMQATSLLQNIQAEILESQRAVTGLKEKSGSLEDTQKELTELEAMLAQKMQRRYRVGFEKWMLQEQERDKQWQASSDGLRYKGTANGDVKGKGKAKATPDEYVDLHALHAVPEDAEQVKAECEALKGELEGLRSRRKAMFKEFVEQQIEAGTGVRMAEYRRLIGVCTGVAPEEVDGMLELLLEELESDDVAVGGMTSGMPDGGL